MAPSSMSQLSFLIGSSRLRRPSPVVEPTLTPVCPSLVPEAMGLERLALVDEAGVAVGPLLVATVHDQTSTGQALAPFHVRDHLLRHQVHEQEAVDTAAALETRTPRRQDRDPLRQDERMAVGLTVTVTAEEAVAEATATMTGMHRAAVAEVGAEAERPLVMGLQNLLTRGEIQS